MLVIGTDKTPILEHLRKLKRFLLIDDGTIIDALDFPDNFRVTRFDISTHSFNPIAHIPREREHDRYLRMAQFAETIAAAFPAGENTLTKENAGIVLLDALLAKRKRSPTLDMLLGPSKDPYEQAAYTQLRRVLMSPVLRRVLTNATNFHLSGIILARLDRATLDDFECRLLGRLLAAQYRGTVVFSDFGFYAIPSHSQLIQQGRLIASVTSLAQKRLADLKDDLLLYMTPRIGCRCTVNDAETLAEYAGLRPDPTRIDNPYNNFIDECMR